LLPPIALEQTYSKLKRKYQGASKEYNQKNLDSKRIQEIVVNRQYKEPYDELMKKQSEEEAKNGTKAETYM